MTLDSGVCALRPGGGKYLMADTHMYISGFFIYICSYGGLSCVGTYVLTRGPPRSETLSSGHLHPRVVRLGRPCRSKPILKVVRRETKPWY
jgi:hypothetical protein